MEETVEGIIVVLGSPNAEDGSLYSVAKERSGHALLEYEKRPSWKLLLTGGFGELFNTGKLSHAAYLKRYLRQQGIPDQAFVEFAESTSTLEDASLSKPIVLRHEASEILVVTSNFHEDRAKYIFEREYLGTGVRVAFSVCATDESDCPFDMDMQKKHEREALARLKRKNGDGYRGSGLP